MKRLSLLTLVIIALAATAAADSALAQQNCPMQRQMQAYVACNPWHGGYYHSAWGMPVALVVPPTAESQVHWGWGVGNTRVTTIWHQFQRYPAGSGYYDRRMFQPTPYWPSDTDQFGVYYVRGPW